jgi:hypothetical protein
VYRQWTRRRMLIGWYRAVHYIAKWLNPAAFVSDAEGKLMRRT